MGNLLCVNRSETDGSLELNVQSLTTKAEVLPDGTKFIIENGPVVKTQDSGKVYMDEKGQGIHVHSNKASMELYEIFSKQINVAQVYFFGIAYLIENTGNVKGLMMSLNSIIDQETILKEIVEKRLKDLFAPSLNYMDTHRDRQVLKGFVAEPTSTRFTSRLQGLQSRKGTINARRNLKSGLQHYSEIRLTSQMVRSDLTTLQQYKLTERVISARKLREIKTIAEGRGRKLKSTQFPELPTVLLYAFGEYNVKEDGGGVEAHPRLTTGTLYRAVDNVTTMKRARDILLYLAPSAFQISLSPCYNYTENYRKGNRQAIQHHSGKGVNAPLSLKKPPRIGVEQLVVNLHWTTANVNLIVDSCQELSHCSVISKDAKDISFKLIYHLCNTLAIHGKNG